VFVLTRLDRAEHGHSHGPDHGASTSPTAEMSARVASPETPAVGSGVIPLTTQISRLSRRTRADSIQSLYGHPAQTRQAVVQAAEEYFAPESISNDESLDAVERGEADRFETSSADPTPESVVVGANATQKDMDENDHRIVLQGVAKPARKASRSRSKKRKSGHAHGHGHSHGSEGSMNVRAIILHVFGDALGSLGVVVSGLIIWLTPLKWRFYFDPLLSVIIVIIILFSAIPLGKPFNLDGSISA
jgi:solute carrier family 30 (zinc transporter), member 1